MSHSPALDFACGGVLAFMLNGCGDDPAAAPTPPLLLDSGGFGTTVAPIVDAAAPPLFPILDAAPAAPEAGSGSVNLTPDAATGGIMLGGVDASTPAMAADAGPIVITIPTRTVPCGGSDCTTTNNRTCCQAWSLGVGFEGTPSCSTLAACETDHLPFGETNRAVISDCDEPADCGGGQVCCFIRYGMPVFADIFSTEMVGPGASRMCLNLAACNAGMMSFSGVLGIPLGLVSCKTAADCTDGTSCMPEQPDSTTSGKGGPARPGVLVCR